MNDVTSMPTPVRGTIWYADLSPVVGSEQGGLRPVVVIQNDVGNKYSPTIIAAAITSQVSSKHRIPTHVKIPCGVFKGAKNSLVLCEQVRTLDKSRLRERVGKLPAEYMRKIDKAIQISLELI